MDIRRYIAEVHRENEIRDDFVTALEDVSDGSDLSYDIGYGFNKLDIHNLALAWKDREDLHDKILELLEDCNFHTEYGDFENGREDKYIMSVKELNALYSKGKKELRNVAEDMEMDKGEREKTRYDITMYLARVKSAVTKAGGTIELTPKERADEYIEKYGSDALTHFKADSVDYTKMTPQEKQTYGIINSTLKSKEFNERLAEGVNKVFENDKFREWLTFCNQFHNYSFNNTMNIFMQCPEATMVASKSDWAKMGRRISDEHFGKGITIAVPNFREFTDKDKLDKYLEGQVADGWVSEREAENYRKELAEKGKVGILSGFSYGKVYDVSMTYGKELPKNEARQHLDLDVENYKDVRDCLVEVSNDNGVPVEYAKANDGHLDRAYGYFSPANNKIVVRDTDYEDEPRSEADVIRTTAHEMAHSMLHGKEMLTAGVDSSDKAFSKSDKEIEAEGTALLVCEHIGFDSGANSYGYLAGYLPEDTESRIEILKKATDKILKCSAEINARFDEEYEHLELLREDDRLAEDEQNRIDEPEMLSFGKDDVMPEQNKHINKGKIKE